MSVTREEVLAVAALARLDLGVKAEAGASIGGASPEAAVDRLAGQMDAVVGYMDILNQVDTTGVEPLYSPMQASAGPRHDCAEKTLTAEEVLANAPQKQGRFFAVPPVI